MNFLNEYLKELGGDTESSFTICPDSISHFSCVKEVVSVTQTAVILKLKKKIVTVSGEGLLIDRLFEGDVIIHGRVSGVKIE